MKLFTLTLFLLFSSVKWVGVDAGDVEDFTDGGMSDTVQNYDGRPY